MNNFEIILDEELELIDGSGKIAATVGGLIGTSGGNAIAGPIGGIICGGIGSVVGDYIGETFFAPVEVH